MLNLSRKMSLTLLFWFLVLSMILMMFIMLTPPKELINPTGYRVVNALNMAIYQTKIAAGCLSLVFGGIMIGTILPEIQKASTEANSESTPRQEGDKNAK